MKKHVASLLTVIIVIAILMTAPSTCTLNKLPELAIDAPVGAEPFIDATMPSRVATVPSDSDSDRIVEVFDDTVIDYTFTHIIDSALPPFTFRILGEVFGERQSIRINSLIVSDTKSAVIQEIDGICAWPRCAAENNLFGFEFGDYNSDGCLDISIRRFPGESEHNRTHYFWIWDQDLEQFVYDWKLSEAVTEDNYFNYYSTYSIHDEIPPFTFRLMGRWVEGWSSKGWAENTDIAIHVIQIIDTEGNITQEFDGLNAHVRYFTDSFGLHFADYNFDGFLDMALYMFEGGSARNMPHYYWLWDKDSGQFVYNQKLTDLSMYTGLSIDEEHLRLRAFSRGGWSEQVEIFLEYHDGEFIEVEMVRWEYYYTPEDTMMERITVSDMINDTESITVNEVAK